MISGEKLAQEYINIVHDYYPETGKLLKHCYVKIIKFNLTRNSKNYYYLGIYYPEKLEQELIAKRSIFREIAENMGLLEVVLLNANRLIKDPFSKFKKVDPRFWLELSWIANKLN